MPIRLLMHLQNKSSRKNKRCGFDSLRQYIHTPLMHASLIRFARHPKIIGNRFSTIYEFVTYFYEFVTYFYVQTTRTLRHSNNFSRAKCVRINGSVYKIHVSQNSLRKSEISHVYYIRPSIEPCHRTSSSQHQSLLANTINLTITHGQL